MTREEKVKLATTIITQTEQRILNIIWFEDIGKKEIHAKIKNNPYNIKITIETYEHNNDAETRNTL